MPRGEVIFFDEFSNPDSGLYQTAAADKRCEYTGDGRYRIWLSNKTTAATYESLVVSDFVLDVDVSQVAGGSSGIGAGVVVRAQADNNKYDIIIRSGEGAFLISRSSETRGYMTLGYGLASSIRPIGETNHLTVVCRGQQITLYVNGEFVSTVQDDSFTSGMVGVRANAEEGPVREIEVFFDNLYVYALAD